MSNSPIDLILQELVRERDAFATFSREKLKQMDDAIQARKKILEGFHFHGPSQNIVEDGEHPKAEPLRSNEFAGLAYPAMVHRALSLQPARQSLTVNGILEVLELHGVVPRSQDPRNTVKTALNRRKAKVGDIVHTGLGEWGLVEWYSDSELEKFERAQDGANARDAKLHKANMKKGIAAAKARGAHYGKPPKITEEMWNLAIKLFADEGRSISYVHKKVMELLADGEQPMTKASFGNRRKQFLSREPYPAHWRAYFEQKRQAMKLKAEIEKSEPELRIVK
jgi:hypothetical protein